jgi:ABC-type Fe3+-hydroxamate transport system substrate-binding protein
MTYYVIQSDYATAQKHVAAIVDRIAIARKKINDFRAWDVSIWGYANGYYITTAKKIKEYHGESGMILQYAQDTKPSADMSAAIAEFTA